MPPAPEHRLGIGGALILVLLAAGLAALVWALPWFLILIALFVVYTVVVNASQRDRFCWLASERATESICSFARSFDYRAIDTWIIRAVYEELQVYYHGTHPCFPFRAIDHFESDLDMDWEDLDDLGHDVAYRAGRSMTDTDKNPMYRKVKTVRDLVLFLAHQPRAQTRAGAER